ncbi:mutS domain V domain-containing protein [Ditylenchus destructor]|uniref:MutS domain V domain-containing protein n=1 Tax=Ditylenchus destructor TaxID=166010 RepID=A0AAD4R0D1_9BILA|nr:mutS domain V domain-containing protein [Ditylenchus destructor]
MTATILCVSFGARKLGAAVYEEDVTTIRILNDIAEDDDYTILKSLLEEVHPSHVIINKSQDLNFIMAVRKECNQLPSENLELDSTNEEANCTTSDPPLFGPNIHHTEASNVADGNEHGDQYSAEADQTENPGAEHDDVFRPALNLFPGVAFGFNDAKKRLDQMFTDNVHDPRLMASFRFDYSETNMVCILNELVEVDEVTKQALEIFYSDYNPQNIRRKFVFGNQRKEGMSLFKLCNICRSTPGRTMLRNWFERPTKSREVLQQRQEGISFFYHDCNLDAMNYVRNKLKDIMSLRGIIKRMRRGNISINDWKSVYMTICTLVKIGEYLKDREIRLNILKDKMAYFGDDLVRLATVLIQMVDFKESMLEGRFVLNSGVDERLDELKITYEKLPDILTNLAKLESEDFQTDSCSVAYVPIIGYLLMVPEQSRLPDEALAQLVFEAEGMCYYKSQRMEKLDEEIGDIKMHIIDLETTITLRLESLVIQRSGLIFRALDALAILDCLTSLAAVAREYNWTRPRFVDESIIDITMARHPIAEQICKSASYIPNPIMSSQSFCKVKILSGPNASGKSVYLKMVGAITYLAHVGSFVPAEKATIGPINRIMSRMYTVDSVLDGMSSFANDLKQMSAAIRKSDGDSLFLIDEFGKGTMTEVGLSLLASCLNYWLEKPPEECPHLFLASHFHALRNLLVDTKLVRFQTMDVIRKENAKLEFQYKLIDGTIDNSYAVVTALKMGIPQDIVDRADEVYLHLKAGSSLAEMERKNKAEEEHFQWLASQMKSILDDFLSWNMDDNALGFLDLAQQVLVKPNEEGDDQILNETEFDEEEVKNETEEFDDEEVLYETDLEKTNVSQFE